MGFQPKKNRFTHMRTSKHPGSVVCLGVKFRVLWGSGEQFLVRLKSPYLYTDREWLLKPRPCKEKGRISDQSKVLYFICLWLYMLRIEAVMVVWTWCELFPYLPGCPYWYLQLATAAGERLTSGATSEQTALS